MPVDYLRDLADHWATGYDWRAVSEKIARYVGLGCTYFVPWSPDYPSTQTLELFAREVMPSFR